MKTQPEALRLADELDVGDFDVLTNYAAANELRRLHEANAYFKGALAQSEQGLLIGCVNHDCDKCKEKNT